MSKAELFIYDERVILGGVDEAEVLETCTDDWRKAIKDWADSGGVLVKYQNNRHLILGGCDYLADLDDTELLFYVRGATP